VEAQLATSSSLLHWTRAMLSVRRRHPVFGLGSFVALDVDNPHVLAFLRVLRDGEVPGEPAETILCINNLSSTPQSTRITLPAQAGASLRDVFGGSGFESVPDDGVLSMTLGTRDFFWLQVGEPNPPAAPAAAPAPAAQASAVPTTRPGGGTSS
jgi:maltose alpha-D-glucosyltransferase/alpha-amylase